MRIATALGWAILNASVIAACGSSSSGGASPGDGGGGGACIPGDSKACTGVGGCSGGQACNQSGTGYGDCMCGGGGTDSGASSNDSGSDATVPTDGGADAGPSTKPNQLANLLLWVSGADFGDAGTTIGTWPDQSAAHRDLISQGAPPTIHANAINGLPAATFAPTSFMSTAGTSFGTGNFVVEVVATPATFSCGANCGLFQIESSLGSSSNTPGVCNLFFRTTATTAIARTDCTVPDTVTSAPFAAGPHVFGFRRTGLTSAEVRVDGVATTFTLASESIPSGSPRFEFQDPNADIAEIVIASAPSDADVLGLEGYLKSKYGL